MHRWLPGKLIGFALVIVVGFSEVRAQGWYFGGSIGVGSYSLNSLHDYQSFVLSGIPVKATVVQSFPSYTNYAFKLGKDLPNNWTISVEWGHGSTGGRIYYADYSGELIADQLYTYDYLGFTPAVDFVRKEKFRIGIGMKTLMVFNTVEISNKVTIGGQVASEDPSFVANTLGLQPHVYARKSFGIFYVSASAGYEAQLESSLHMKGDSNTFLAGKNNSKVMVSASGYRLDLGVGIIIRPKSKSAKEAAARS